MKVTDTAVDHRTTIYVFVALAAFVGTATYITIPREAFPEIEIPYIAISTRYAGVSPADIESSITTKIEKKLKGIADVEHVTSTSREGSSSILVEFAPNVRSDVALQRVRDKVEEAKGELPAEAEDPTLSEIDVSQFPIMMINVYGPVGLVRLKEIADDLADRIEGIRGVLDAEVSGGLTRQIRILVDRSRLAAYQIPVSRFLTLIQAEEKNVSGGLVKMSDFQLSIRVPGEFVSPAEIDSLVVDARDGKPIYLSDVATVVDSFEDPLSIARFDGRPSVSIAVKKRSGENIIRIADGVRAIVAEARKRLPAGVQLAISLDRSDDIRKLLGDLENNMVTALILVVGVLMLFLGFRTSLIVALAIPLSMMISMAVLSLMGMVLNFIVLFGLVLSLGMMVDNSIVVVENIYRHRQQGFPRIEAAKTAASEVGWPVITSTLTTICAFAPMLFWPGIMGQVMGYIPRTLIVTLSASLFVALIINPTITLLLMPQHLGPNDRSAPRRGWPARVLARLRPGGGRQEAAGGDPEEPRPPWWLRAYTPILRAALRHRALTVTMSGLALIGAVAAFAAFNATVEFFPKTDPNKAIIDITGPVGMRLETTDGLALAAEAAAVGFQNVEYVTANVGGGAAGDREMVFGGGAGGLDHQARVTLNFVDYAVRPSPSRATLEEIRGRLADFVGAEVKVEEPEEGPPTGAPVSIELSGPDYEALKRLLTRVRNIVAKVPGVTNLKDDLEEQKPELRIQVDRRRAALVGLSTGTVAATVKAAVTGLEVGTFREGEDEYNIVVRFPEAARRRVEDLETITIAGPDGAPVPIAAVARHRYVSGLGTIRRKDNERVITVTADTLPGYNSRKVLQAVQAALRPVEEGLPSLFELAYTGEREEEQKARAFLTRAGVVAVLLIAMVLVTQFNSLVLPFIILISVVLSWIGVFSGLALTGMPFGVIMGGVGVISLAGVVVNNAIVLVDYTRKLRHRGLELVQAVVKAGQTRLRPVLLTAITTIMGLVPMALGFNFDFRHFALTTRSETSQWWAQMSVVIIFGLALSTLFTLVVIPVLYTLFEGARQRVGERLAGTVLAKENADWPEP